MARKKKPVQIGKIRKEDLIKHSRPIQHIPFRTGAYLTEEDRPRKKFRSEDFNHEDLVEDYDDDFDLEV